MAVSPNLVKSADINARIREIDFILKFEESMKDLINALGITRKIPKADGTVLKSYKTTGTLESGTVAEGEEIPLSKYHSDPVNYGTITLKKWRKSTSVEAITDKGFDAAVTETNKAMLKDVQKNIRKSFFDFLKTGEGVATGTDFQAALAQTWGQLQVKFEDDAIQSVHFVNPLDVADYLATAQITTQTAFGMSYIKDFLGMGTTFLTPLVTKGTFYSTAKDNIVLYYIPVNGSGLKEAFSFTTDSTGLIGIHEEADYSHMTASNIIISGTTLFAEKLDGIIVSTIAGAGA